MKDEKNVWILIAVLIVAFILIKACQERPNSALSESKKDEISMAPPTLDSTTMDSLKLQEIKDGIEFVDQIRVEKYEG